MTLQPALTLQLAPLLVGASTFARAKDMSWEIVRNGEDTDGEVLEANAWLGPHSPSPPVHVHDNVEDSFEIVEGRLDVAEARRISGVPMVRESAPRRLPVTGTPCETVTMSR